MKKILFLFITVLALGAGAQTAANDPYSKFLHSFISGKTRKYADSVLVSTSQLMTDKGCTQTMCLIKVEVDSLKKVKRMDLSDSADPLFKKRFAEKQHYLDVGSLETYLKSEFRNSNSRIFMIPFSYFIYTENCEQQIPVDILRNYNKFQGSAYYGTLLKPISFEVIVQH